MLAVPQPAGMPDSVDWDIFMDLGMINANDVAQKEAKTRWADIPTDASDAPVKDPPAKNRRKARKKHQGKEVKAMMGFDELLNKCEATIGQGTLHAAALAEARAFADTHFGHTKFVQGPCVMPSVPQQRLSLNNSFGAFNNE